MADGGFGGRPDLPGILEEADDGLLVRRISAGTALWRIHRAEQGPLFFGDASVEYRFNDAGLRAGRRTHVHLSADERTAEAVGRRHGRPVVLRVDAAAMHAAGHAFYIARNGVWLTDAVPPEFIVFPPGA